jgi:hypothetical protein
MENGYEKYINLERYLNCFKYKGIPVGGTLADKFILADLHGVNSILNTLLDYVSELYGMFISLFARKKYFANTQIIATRLANKSHFNNMMNPLIDHFGKSLTLVINPAIKDVYPGVQTISIKDTFKTNARDIFSIIGLYLKIKFKLISKRRRLKLSYKEVFYYSICLLHQIRIISFYYLQFKTRKILPKVILTEFDRNNIASPLILAAKYFNIPTVTLVHGIFDKYGFVPVLANYIYCFGNEQKKQLIDLKVPESRIKVTGTSIIRELDQQLYRTESNFDKKFIVCLGINPISKIDIDWMLETILKVKKRLDNIELIIKLHPSQNKNAFIRYENIKNNIRVLASNEIDNMALFQMIDLLIVHNTGLGIEAMLNNVLVAILDIPGTDLGMGIKMVEKGGAPLLKDDRDIQKFIDEILTDKDYKIRLKQNEKVFAREYYYATGADAVKNIVTEIETLLFAS